MALYFNDFNKGDRFETVARTVTETDLVSFAMLSGDWNPIHSDEEFARTTRFGKRIVHGIFGIALITGLIGREGWFEGSAVAMLGIQDWTFKAPVFVGDTLHAVMEITSKRLTSGGDRGVVDRRFSLVNQQGEVVQGGHIAVMLRVASETEVEHAAV